MFKDPIKIKSQQPKSNQIEDKMFQCPKYDERSSCFVKAGTDYGMGHRQPVGSLSAPKSKVDVLPKNGAIRMDIYDKSL